MTDIGENLAKTICICVIVIGGIFFLVVSSGHPMIVIYQNATWCRQDAGSLLPDYKKIEPVTVSGITENYSKVTIGYTGYCKQVPCLNSTHCDWIDAGDYKYQQCYDDLIACVICRNQTW